MKQRRCLFCIIYSSEKIDLVFVLTILTPNECDLAWTFLVIVNEDVPQAGLHVMYEC